MTPRSTAFGALALLVVLCAAGLMILRGADRPEPIDLDPRAPGDDDTPPASVANVPPTTTAALSGRVLDPAGRPVDGAVVRLVSLTPDVLAGIGRTAWLAGEDLPARTVEASDGTYAFEALLVGRYALRAAAPEHAAVLEIVTVGGTPVLKDLVLVKERSVAGVVVHAASGEPIPGASVAALRAPAGGIWFGGTGLGFLREPRGRTIAGPDGSFRIGGLLRGRYEVLAMREGFARGIVFADAGRDDVRLALGPGSAIAGRVSGPDLPLDGVEILVFREDMALESEARSSAGGQYRVAGLTPGAKSVVVRASGFRPVRKTGVTVVEGNSTRLDVTLEPGLVVAGRVVDEAGAPLAAATVSVLPLAGVPLPPVATGPDGSFAVEGLPAGQTRVQADLPGYGRREVFGVVAGTLDVEVVLARTGALRILVRGAGGGAPLAAFWVRQYRMSEEAQASFRNRLTAARRAVDGARDGTHRIEGLAPGDYVVEVGAPGHAPARAEGVAVPPAGESEQVVLEPGPAATIVGRVVRASDDAPIAGADIVVNVTYVMQPVAPSDDRSTSGADGSFRLSEQPPGPVSMTVSHPGYASATLQHEARVEPGEPVVIRLSAGGSVEGIVYDERGRPQPAAFIHALPGGSAIGRRSTSTNGEGRFVVDRLPPGMVTVAWFIDPDRAQIRMQQVTVREGEVTEIEFHALESGAEIQGTVRGADGPLAGAMVTLVPLVVDGTVADGTRTSSLRLERTEEDGTYRLRGLPPGRYLLSVVHEMSQTSLEVAVPAGARLTHDIRISTGILGGTVRDARGEPVAEATVLVIRQTDAIDRRPGETVPGFAGQDATDAGGRFSIRGLAAGTYLVRIYHETRGTAFLEDLSLAEGEVREDVVVPMPDAADLVVVVSGPDGVVKVATVLVLDAKGRPVTPSGRELTAEAGRILVPMVGPGVHRVLVTAPGHAVSRLDGVEVGENGAEVRVRLSRGGGLEIQARDTEGRPVENARIGLEAVGDDTPPPFLPAAGKPGPSSRTGPDGRARLDHLAAGKYVVTLTVGDRSVRSEEVVLNDGEIRKIRLETDGR